MEFSILADSFNKMESTRKRLELTQFLVELFEKNSLVRHDYRSTKYFQGEDFENVTNFEE